jgi:hypothetical protein
MEFFIELINLWDKEQSINIPDFATMFEIPLTNNNSLSYELQCGYAHYNKDLNHIELKQQKEALKSMNNSVACCRVVHQAYIFWCK